MFHFLTKAKEEQGRSTRPSHYSFLPNHLFLFKHHKFKGSLYRGQAHFCHCTLCWKICRTRKREHYKNQKRKRNATENEKVNERALRYVYCGKHTCTSYQHLLKRIRLPFLESRGIQDMFLTFHKGKGD